jgi:hypothetical protein
VDFPRLTTGSIQVSSKTGEVHPQPPGGVAAASANSAIDSFLSTCKLLFAWPRPDFNTADGEESRWLRPAWSPLRLD